ncbi:hypothetical protein [Streptomyces aureocirculatus]|uniref:hypothetical protein n=1 Tax=Streptomyces aureocirculatus TaxID=67275 RepID=UPI001CEC1C20|nr:hypothetical protein [Streptomyces aureocirculatus]
MLEASAGAPPGPGSPAPGSPAPAVDAAAPATDTATATARQRREFAVLLGEFRRTAVLLPLGADESPLVADLDGIRWLYAFSDEAALARFALARGDAARAWDYQRLLGARLLDAVVPGVGVPCGVALDVGSEGHEVLFPPVLGIVPDQVAVDANEEERQ